MKRVFTAAVAVLIATAFLFPCPVSAVSARRGILLDGATGRVLWERSPDEKSLIASTTKIMTALVICQQCNVLDRVRIPKEAVGIEGSSMYLREGEILTIQELLYGLMLQSGNDAATALAIYWGGTVEGFAGLMNDKARELGMTNTHFANPHGLDAPEHYSTARDLAILAAEAMADPIFRKTVSTKSVKIGERYLTNHNKLLWRVEGANGVKTGYTKAAGRILVSGAQRQGRQLICVTIDAPDDWNDHGALLEDGFSRFRSVLLVEENQCLGMQPVAGGQAGQVPLMAGESFSYPLAKGERVSIVLPGAFVYAPAVENGCAGYAHIFVDDVPVGKVPLYYGATVEQQKEK